MHISALALAAFLVTAILVLWRPGGIHEAIPALIGAGLLFLLGLVQDQDVLQVVKVVGNSATTIISTFVMASILEGAGFFKWVGDRMLGRANGSGHRLFHLVLAFSACLTLFLNNDGSVLLGTPLVLALVRRVRLSRPAAFAYLLGACLIASASSPPLGVSNMANLEAMSLVGVSLTQHLQSVLVPAVVGLGVCWLALYAVFRRVLPLHLDTTTTTTAPAPPWHPLAPEVHGQPVHLPPPLPPGWHRPPIHPHPPKWHPPQGRPPAGPPAAPQQSTMQPDYPFMWFAVVIVVIVRVGFFVASDAGIPTSLVAVAGALVLLLGNLHRQVMDTRLAIRQAPWPILGFAFGMDLVVFGLQHGGFIGLLAGWMRPAIEQSLLVASLLPGITTAAIASLLNNHPALIIGSLMLRQMTGLPKAMELLAYAGVVMGSDLGALVTPSGTLAGLIWFHILRQQGYRYTWWDYVKVTLTVIPVSFLAALGVLYGLTWLGFG